MASGLRTFAIGDATVSILNVGDIALPLLPSMRAPEDRRGESDVIVALSGHLHMPMQDVLIRLGTEIVLVDAGFYDVDASSSYHIAGYQPPPRIECQLLDLGIDVGDVTRVVITHRHWDHFNGTAVDSPAGRQPTFPNAHHYLGRADWPTVQSKLDDPTSRERQSLGVVHSAGHLQLVDEELQLTPEITIIPAPGETPGHQIVRLQSNRETLFAVGDLYHDPVEVRHPGWMVNWADAESNQRSRRRLIGEAMSSDATVVASHIRSPGTIVGDPGAPHWRDRHA